MIQNFKMAFRDLGRNRRRSLFSMLAVAIGLALLMLMSSVITGEMGSAIETAINCKADTFKYELKLTMRINPASSGKTSSRTRSRLRGRLLRWIK